MRLNTKAAVIPLDYEKGRDPEISTVYLSGTWSELLQLIQNPVRFLSDRGELWDQEGDLIDGKQFPWALLPPATMFLEHMLGSADTFVSVLGFLPRKILRGEGVYEPSELMETEAVKYIVSILRPLDRLGIDPSQVVDRLLTKIVDGCFIAQFALETHTVTVRYLPPVTPSPAMRHEYTNASLIFVEEEQLEDLKPATLHFDIGTTRMQRAKFALDYIERWKGVIDEALAQKLFLGPAKLKEPFETIQVRRPSETKIKPECRLPTDVPYPTIMIEGLSGVKPILETVLNPDDPDNCAVCVEVNGVFVNPTDPVFFPGSTIIKCYTEPNDKKSAKPTAGHC